MARSRGFLPRTHGAERNRGYKIRRGKNPRLQHWAWKESTTELGAEGICAYTMGKEMVHIVNQTLFFHLVACCIPSHNAPIHVVNIVIPLIS